MHIQLIIGSVREGRRGTLYEEWGRKPASFIGYGPAGGIRAIEQ
jgi:hypothetical protein